MFEHRLPGLSVREGLFVYHYAASARRRTILNIVEPYGAVITIGPGHGFRDEGPVVSCEDELEHQ